MLRLWTVVSEIRNGLSVLSLLTRAKGTKKIWFGTILVVAAFAPSVGFPDRLDETVLSNGYFDNAAHLEFVAHGTKASVMSSNTEGEGYGTGKREKGRIISVAAREGGLWGAYVYVYHRKDYGLRGNYSYAVSWNFPSEKEALNAAINKCSQTIGVPCWPQRKVYGDWIPQYVVTFSTSVAKDELRVWYGSDGYRFGDRLNAGCILIYREPPNVWYLTLFANSKDEANVKFKERQKRKLEEYQYRYPPSVLVETRCNER